MRSTGPSSKVPFALRWLQALLPYLLGKQKQAVERTYDLLEFCRLQVDRCTSGADAEPVGLALPLSAAWKTSERVSHIMLLLSCTSL